MIVKSFEVKKNKGYYPELNFKSRKEILSSIKYVTRVIPSNFFLDEKYLFEKTLRNTPEKQSRLRSVEEF